MSTSFYGAKFEAVINSLKVLIVAAKIGTNTVFKQVAVGTVPRVTDRPLAIINPLEGPMSDETFSSHHLTELRCKILPDFRDL